MTGTADEVCPFAGFESCRMNCVFYDEKGQCMLRRGLAALAVWAEAQP